MSLAGTDDVEVAMPVDGPGADTGEAECVPHPGDDAGQGDSDDNLGMIYPILILAGLFLLAQLLAVAASPQYIEEDVRAFGDDTDSASNSVYYIVFLLVFSAGVLFLAKKGADRVIQVIFRKTNMHDAGGKGTVTRTPGPPLADLDHPSGTLLLCLDGGECCCQPASNDQDIDTLCLDIFNHVSIPPIHIFSCL